MNARTDAMAAPDAKVAGSDAETIALVGLAHGTSHFFHMLLPPLFLAFSQSFGLSFERLGLLVTVFFVISAIGQALAGFLVDRVGARPVLFGALACFVAAALAAALAQGMGGLVLAAALAGVGNSPFHPIDFTILNKRVAPSRLGHAYSVHGISANLGWAVAPVVLLGVTAAMGSWRYAMVAAAGWAALVLGLMVVRRHAVDDRLLTVRGAAPVSHASVPASTTTAVPTSTSATTSTAAPPHPFAFLRLPSLWLCFSFFFWSTAALSAILSFSGPALKSMHGLPTMSVAAYLVTGYMVCGAVGMVLGGFVAPRVAKLERVIGCCLAFAALILIVVGTGALSPVASVAVASLAGLCVGMAGPSRDMLIKRATPVGATGRVYGTVYSGLDLGFALAAPLFGAILDRGWPHGVFLGAAAALLAGVLSAAAVGFFTRNKGGVVA